MGIHNEEIYKAELIDLYRRVAKVLRRENIEYYAAYGTCLGAVRHGGIIPWDDDVDVVVWRRDLQGVLRALNEGDVGVVAGGGVQSCVYPSSYGRVFNRIRMTDSIERKHAYLDILVLDYADNSYLMFCLRALLRVGIERILSRRHGMISDYGVVHRIADVVVFPLRCLKDSLLQKFSKWVYFLRKSTRFVKVPGVGRKRYPASCFSSVVQMNFNGKQIPVPVGYEQLLTIEYGDWRTPPPMNKRVSNAYAADGKSWNVKTPKDADRLLQEL